MFTEKEKGASGSFIDYPEPLASAIFEYKIALQSLQLAILDGEPTNLKEIGHHFEKLEEVIDLLIAHCADTK